MIVNNNLLIKRMKACVKCRTEKSEDAYRTRTDKRYVPALVYKSNICMSCEAAAQSERYNNKKNDPAYKKKHAKWAMDRYYRRRDEMKVKAKQYRESEQGKATRKQYINKNKDKIYTQEVVCKRRYSDKHKNNLTDQYVISKIIGKSTKLTKEDIQQLPDLIQAKRLQIQLIRLITIKN